ncbi:MAG TPA: hypothetical protein VH142_28225 [Polyangiaceae bacterium]|jgi:hypothetical protein|nr:hypothetical protein [Polyangiaceae bacterium]
MRRSPNFFLLRRRAVSAGSASLALGIAACAANSGANFQPAPTNTGGTAAAASGGSTFASSGGSGGTGGFGATPPGSVTGGATSTLPTASGGGVPSGGPDPGLFNWPETNPDGGGEQLCKPGHYVGTYQCDIRFPAGFPGATADASSGFMVSGPVDLELDQGQDGEFLDVSGGTLKSTAVGILQLGATVVGKLDCLNGLFDGSLQDGTVSIPPFPSGGSFTGPMAASFSATGPGLSGTWTLIGGPQFGGTTCTGPWSATWQAN